MNDKSFGGRVLSFLSSLRLAVVTMVTLGSVCGVRDLLRDAATARRPCSATSTRPPGSPFLLGLLGLNVFSVMVSRYPWTKHHIGFLTAHVGILLLLVGSVVSLYRGLDSNMALFEGETSDRVALLEKALQVSVPGLGVSGTFPVVFEKTAAGAGAREALPGRAATSCSWPTSTTRTSRSSRRSSRRPRAPRRSTSSCRRRWRRRSSGWWRTTRSAATSTSAWSRSASTRRRATRRRRSCSRSPRAPNHLSFVAAPDGTLLFAAADAAGALTHGRRRARAAGADRLAGDGRHGRPVPAAGAPRRGR